MEPPPLRALLSSRFPSDLHLTYVPQVPIVPARLNDMLRHSGMGVISERNVASTKAALEPILAHEAQASMAEARQQDVHANRDEPEPCVTTDTQWDHGRNGSWATTTFVSAKTGKIVHEETTRRADPDIKSAQSMEKVGFIRGINNPFMKAAGYKRMGMDGCCAILKAAEGAGYTGQGDGWHCTKCKAKHFGAHCDAHAPRCQPCPIEKAAKEMPKPPRPCGPAAAVPKLSSVPAQQPPPSSEQMAEQLRAAGEESVEEKDVSKLYKALRKVEHAKVRLVLSTIMLVHDCGMITWDCH